MQILIATRRSHTVSGMCQPLRGLSGRLMGGVLKGTFIATVVQTKHVRDNGH